MYFDDITNEELQYYHGLKVPNFTIKLTDVLHKTSNTFDNKLFKIEEITTDKLYRIYPMFNTGRITSSNPNDKIIDDKVILAEKTTGTTWLTFISDETQEIHDYSSYGTYYSIGDTLTTAQYNSIVSLIRQFGGITRNLTYDQNTITGTYGKYDFSIKTGFTDKGILINNGHLTTETDFHIKLSNAVFNHSTYTVKMTALRLNEINIMGEDESDEEPETIPVEVELTNGEYVHIPTTDLEAGDMLLYDMTVEIKHDKPMINGSWITSILLNVSPLIIQVDGTATLTATATDNNGEPFANKTVKFYNGSTLINSSTTNDNGVATLTYTGAGAGQMNIIAKCDNLPSESIQLFDCIFYDQAVTGHKNNNWSVGEAITVETDETGTTLSIVSANVSSGYQITTSLSGDFEAIVYSESSDGGNSERTSFGITDGTSRRFFRKGGNYWLKLVRENGTTTGYYSTNKEDWTSVSMAGTEITANTVYLILGTYNNTTTTRTIFYNNLIVYSI